VRDAKKVQYRAKLLPDIAMCLVPDRSKLVNFFKQKAMSDLLEEYPNITFMEVCFEVQKASSQELRDGVEYFRRGDRYIYDGNFVSRPRLEKELAKLDATLIMTAWIKENEDEIQ
jgi:hypothetical protein